MDEYNPDGNKGHEWEVVYRYLHERTMTIVYECTKCRLSTLMKGSREARQPDYDLTCIELSIKNFLDE